MNRPPRYVLLVLLVLLAAHGFGPSALRAEVVRAEILERAPFADGRVFGAAGAYERLRGRLFVEVDPDAPANATIHDLKRAPRNARGRVECWTDFFLLAPADPRKGNGRLLHDVNNRGNMLALWTFNRGAERTNAPSTAAHAGDGFLMRLGYAVLWCGWNGEVVDDGTHRLLTGLPIAIGENGGTISGPAHLEFCTAEKVFSRAFSWSPWGVSAAFPPADSDPAKATLTMRPSRDEPATAIPPTDWAFGRWENEALVPDPTSLYVKAGFRPGWLYDLVYTAKEPRVTGLGMAAMRDCVSFFRNGEKESGGAPNPLAGAIDKTIVFGISQSGRLIHHFLHDGLNTDEAGRAVFDGALIHVAGAGKGMFNFRFRMTTEYGTQHEGNLSGSEFFPLAPLPQTDPVTGETGDTLARARASGHAPKIIFTQTSTEYWNRAASLLHTDVAGNTDLDLPKDVRLYLVAGAQHLGGGENTPGNCRQPRNNLDDRGPILRAMLVNLDRWVSDDTPPPPSRYPRIDDGTLIDPIAFRGQFPKIPGVDLPEKHYVPRRLDFGPRFLSEGIPDILPPKVSEPFRALVPAVDADGNEIAGIRLPEVAVPLGTYTGWNLRAKDLGADGALGGLEGMFLPFAATAEERSQTGDPREAIRERYPTRADYLARLTDAALALKRDGFLLDEDVVAILSAAAERSAKEPWPTD
ncbi:MAG: hypothetical protein H7A52_11050 [Akkermansiaceae bacterium]|nr:hypothetical protein [Akkermansiaceae bacterium]